MKDFLKRLRDIFVREQFRLDLGKQFLAYVNFALLILVASDKIKQVVPLRISELLILAIPAAFIGAWALGYVLDKFANFESARAGVYESRSPAWRETQRKLDLVLKKLDRKR